MWTSDVPCDHKPGKCMFGDSNPVDRDLGLPTRHSQNIRVLGAGDGSGGSRRLQREQELYKPTRSLQHHLLSQVE